MKRAFTLIEMMITISLLGILLASQGAIFHSLARLQRQQDFAGAARQAEAQLKQLNQVPFELLPPQVLSPDRQGWLQLGRPDLDVSSLRISRLEGVPQVPAPLQVDAGSGRVQLGSSLAGQSLLVDYAFFPANQGETHRVGADGQIQLENQPVARVQQVWLARAEQTVPFRDWRLLAEGGLQLGPSARGQVLMVDYRGRSQANRVEGQFLSQDLRPQSTPSPLKLLTLREIYAGKQRFSITSLRTAQP